MTQPCLPRARLPVLDTTGLAASLLTLPFWLTGVEQANVVGGDDLKVCSTECIEQDHGAQGRCDQLELEQQGETRYCDKIRITGITVITGHVCHG